MLTKIQNQGSQYHISNIRIARYHTIGAHPLPHLRQSHRGQADAEGGGGEDEKGRRQDAAREHLASSNACKEIVTVAVLGN